MARYPAGRLTGNSGITSTRGYLRGLNRSSSRKLSRISRSTFCRAIRIRSGNIEPNGSQSLQAIVVEQNVSLRRRANGACHAFQSRDGIHKDAGWRRAVSRIQGMYGSRSVRRGEPAWLDLLPARANPARPHGGFEASDPLRCGVIVGIATDKIEPVACRAAGVSRACNELLGQDSGACTIVRDDGGRVLPRKINVYGRNVGLLAKEVEPFWILYAHNEQCFDLLRQERSDGCCQTKSPQCVSPW